MSFIDMIPEHIRSRESGEIVARRVPSLVDLCVKKAVDNLSQIGYVGYTPAHLLERFLPHCTVYQLMQIEDASQGIDISEVTNKLWKKFYEKEFGSNNVSIVDERMKQNNISFKWKQLFEAKGKDAKEAKQRSFDRIKQLYLSENARKQSRQIRLCTKIPPTPSKRSFFGGGGPGSSGCNFKSSLMKKAKMEALNSLEVKNLAVSRQNRVQSNCRTSTARVSAPSISRRL